MWTQSYKREELNSAKTWMSLNIDLSPYPPERSKILPRFLFQPCKFLSRDQLRSPDFWPAELQNKFVLFYDAKFLDYKDNIYVYNNSAILNQIY